jgi:hypothetical protein
MGRHGQTHQVVRPKSDLLRCTNLLPGLTVTGEEAGEGIPGAVHAHPLRSCNLRRAEVRLQSLTNRGVPLDNHPCLGVMTTMACGDSGVRLASEAPPVVAASALMARSNSGTSCASRRNTRYAPFSINVSGAWRTSPLTVKSGASGFCAGYPKTNSPGHNRSCPGAPWSSSEPNWD